MRDWRLTPMLRLTQADFIAEGSGRKIYHYPQNPDLVVKLHKPFKSKPLIGLHNLIRRNRRRFGPLMHSFVEADEIASVVGQTGHLPDYISQYRGLIATTLGTGAVFEAVRCQDGSLAPTLMAYAPTSPFRGEMVAAIDQLWDKIIADHVVISDPSLRNVAVCEDNDEFHLILIDGLGERTLIPIQTWSRHAHRFACEKARKKMQQDYATLAAKG